MTVTGVEVVTFGVEDVATARRFLDDWGLRRVRSGKFGANYQTVDGCEVRVRSIDDKNLPAAIEPGDTAREVIWGVSSKRELDAIARELSKDRKVTIDKDGIVRSVDDIGLGIGFRKTAIKKIKAQPAALNAPGNAQRVNKPAPFYERATPLTISHVVFGCDKESTIREFYTKRLGFLVTDRYKGRAAFLRGAPEGNHHHLFVLNTADGKPHFNHIAFKVRDVYEVVGGGQYIEKKGWKTQVGPGRHYVSSGCFWYFQSPLGGAIEYVADEDMVTAKWKPRDLEFSNDIFTEWVFMQSGEEATASAPMASSKSR